MREMSEPTQYSDLTWSCASLVEEMNKCRVEAMSNLLPLIRFPNDRKGNPYRAFIYSLIGSNIRKPRIVMEFIKRIFHDHRKGNLATR